MKLSEMPKSSNGNFNNEKISSAKHKNITQTYEELKNCSGQELMDKLTKEIQMQKANGTFDCKALLNTIERIKIYLPNATYQNMVNIIEGLK